VAGGIAVLLLVVVGGPFVFFHVALGTVPVDGKTISALATGKLTLHGTTRSATFQVQARKSGSTIQVSGSIPITFADYNISNPSGGPASVGNSGTLEFLINLTKS